MRKQIYNFNCRKQTSGVQGQCPWRGPRGSAPGGVQGQRPWRGPRGSAPGGVQGQRPWRGPRGSAPGGGPAAGDRGRSPRNKNKLLTS